MKLAFEIDHLTIMARLKSRTNVFDSLGNLAGEALDLGAKLSIFGT